MPARERIRCRPGFSPIAGPCGGLQANHLKPCGLVEVLGPDSFWEVSGAESDLVVAIS